MRDRRHFLLFAVLVGALLLCAYVCLLLPMRQELVAAEERLLQQREELAGIRDYMSAHQDRTSYEAHLKKQSALVHRLLPDAMDTQEFLESLERKAKASNVFIYRVLPEKFDGNADLEEQFISVECTCDYFSLLSFLGALEEDRFCKIKEADTKAEGETLRTRLRLSIYALP